MPRSVRSVSYTHLALSVSVSVPLAAPAALGTKTMASVQEAFAGSVAAQVLATIVKPGLMAMVEMASGRPPLLVRASVCAMEIRRCV